MRFACCVVLMSIAPAATAGQPGPGSVLASQKISATAGGFTGQLDDLDQFGKSVAALGDLDGDGVLDLAVGTYRDDDGAADAGAIWILFLADDGSVRSHRKISATTGGFTGVLDVSDWFGSTSTAIGDIDGDGVVDIAVGAPGDDDGGTERGAVWVLRLNADGTVKASQKISSTAGGFGGGLDDVDFFGVALASLGDLDDDGVSELAVGALRDDDGAPDAGAVWVLFLTPTGAVKAKQKISATQGGFSGALDAADSFGGGLGRVTDLDGDGIVELAIGATRDDDGGGDQGAVWIAFLHSNGTVKHQRKLSATYGGFGGALDPGNWFGNAIADLGDLDGDGVTDLAIGAPFDGDGGANTGAVWVTFLNADGSAHDVQKISATSGGLVEPGPNGTFGWSLSVLGDLDGDQCVDLAVGSNRDGDGGFQHGAAWTLFLADDRWQDVGGAVAGSAGTPALVAVGSLLAQQPVRLELTNVVPSAPIAFVVGASYLGAPFAGGVFVPRPDVTIALTASAGGTLEINAAWPQNVPSGASVWMQVWCVDAGGTLGVAASNGLSATPP